MFELIFDKKAGQELKKLPKEMRERIFKKLIQTKQDPFRYFEYLKEIKGFKLRIGNYRVIADINRKEQNIKILKIGHRKNIYERL
ncbi:MAG: type II toxin-antitoxin system RelE/ParE family toxin [Candidatus Pacearchaeota archaeon]|nr:MAG: type II toxin-antitoxin system RelE/ParE family toxin [Candidatus Pacearchaeota archaeon]